MPRRWADRRRSAGPSTPVDNPSEAQQQYLGFIQATITRHNSNSFLIKGWTLTVVGALVALAITQDNWAVGGSAAVATLGFWWLDSFYLRQERLFRELYNEARAVPATVDLYDMNAEVYKTRTKTKWRLSIFTPTHVVFYGTFCCLSLALTGVLVLYSSSR
ncbi:hypothetical protein CLV63_11551 [Murinocardiopsis flavida]|uniref:Uncharacterized protein n=1 Tax=Murinocardiopsis flavida TaxID=645275 RepID=A0A2P8DDT3_9ACTN|nr:hypothetical protein [Murinocardiopsis flavida]PSK95391.1 hypothetical protein CLV63_11551 [Murinocardiopsis flavida]